MRIRLLGSVDVELDGRSLKLAGPKQRAVLSMLALNANATVSLEQLVDGLWGEDPPDTAPKMVQQYVSQLRRVLGDSAEIVTHGRGYELRVASAAVDALRFERLVEQAAGEADGARTQLAREALGLWEGAPLADVLDEPFAASEARRLQELHLAAVELTIEGELAAGRHAEAISRLGALVDEHPLRERLRVLLMLALYRAGRQAEALEVFQDARWTLVEQLGLEPGPELRRLQEAILRQDPALDLVVPDGAWASRETAQQVDAGAGRASQRRSELRDAERDLVASVIDLQALRERSAVRRAPSPACPFKGLESFDAADADYFFGRERLVAEIVAKLPGTALVGVVGPSGSGKSSAVRAGVMPALAVGVLPGSERWTSVVIRPGAHPMGCWQRVPSAGDRRLVVVVDQFEEVFTACRDDDERGAFVDAIVDAAEAHGERFLAVLALRADFYGACAAYPRLAHLLGRSQVVVGPMRSDELTRAIEGPAERAGLFIEAELVARLVQETAGQPGGLPLLSTALLELWRRRSGNRMLLQTYEQTGGVQGAVARLAESAYASLGPEEAGIARNMLMRLAGTEEVDAAVRRRVPLAELDLTSSARARRVLEVLTENRLLTVGGDSVEIAHEALLREWPRVRGWLEQDAEARRLHRHITLAAQDWDAAGRDPGELYRGARLAAALDLAAERGDALNALERAFLDEARMVSERDALRSRRLNRRLRTFLAAALLALAAATVAGVVALSQRGDARHAAVVADAQRLGAQALTDDRLDRALLLARTGVALDDSVATRGNLFATLLRVQPGSLGQLPELRDVEIYSVAVSPRGGRIVVGDAFGEIQVFEAATRRRAASRRLGHGLVQRIVYSPDGRTLAVTSLKTDDGRTALDLFDARTLRRRWRAVLPRLPKRVDFVGASPAFTADGRDLVVLESPFPSNQPQVLHRVDGRTGAIVGRAFRMRAEGGLDPVMSSDRRSVLVTSAHEDATYQLDAADLRVVRRYRAGGIALALSPGSRTLALGAADGSIRLVDLRSGRAHRLAGPRGARITRMSFSPDGATLASNSENGKLTLWDVASGVVREQFAAHAGSGEGLAITPDGRTIITSGVDGRVALWDLTGARRLIRPVRLRKPFRVDDFTPRGIAVSPDDRTLAVSESDGTIDLIDTRTLERRSILRSGPGAALAVDFSPDGRLLAVGGERGRVTLWDARTLAPAGHLAGLHDWTQAVAFSPDGRFLAASDVNGEHPRTLIWDLPRRTLTAFRSDLGASALAFSPDGRLLAGAGGEQGMEVREVSTARPVARFRTPELPRSIAFSPNGRLLFVGLLNGAGQFFSTRDWRPDGARIRGQGQRLLHPRFTPDGRTLATSSADGTVMLWDVASHKPVGSPLKVQPDAFVSAALSRDGSRLYALPTGTRGIRVELSPALWKRQACAIAGRELSRREWRDALPGRRYREVCGY